MKKVYLLLLAGFSAFLTAFGQINHTLSVDPSSSTQAFPAELKPGLFYFHYWLPEINAVIAATSHAKMYNTFRETKFHSECWKYSTSHTDVLGKMQSQTFQNWLATLTPYTDRLIVKFNGMPLWLSSSSNMNPMSDPSWQYYMTYPPADYNKWDSIVRAVVATISGWGFHPLYELWNEPDGEYWSGTNAELLKLYKHTALAIKQADPLAKIGGFGMNRWWASASATDKGPQSPHEGMLTGFHNDSVPGRFSVLYMLMDSVINNWAADTVPLDFISWHSFNLFPGELKYIVNKFNAEMLSLGYCPPNTSPCTSGRYYPEHCLTEWQTTFGAVEQAFQPGLYFRVQKKFAETGIKMHCIAATRDFQTNPTDEFFNNWGLLSQNALVKPAYKEIQLLDQVISKGNMLPVQAGPGIDALAGISGDTLRMLLSNFVWPYAWYSPTYTKIAFGSFEKLLYDTASTYNKWDYIARGYTSAYWGNVVPPATLGNLENYFMGLSPAQPGTPAPMLTQLAAAKQQWTSDTLAMLNTHTVTVSIPNNTGTLTAKYIILDSTHNNIIYRYDSLITAGYTHQRAVDSLKSCSFLGGCYGLLWTSDSITFSGTSFQLILEANSIVYILIDGVSLSPVSVHEQNGVTSRADVFPNPFHDIVSFRLPAATPCKKLIIRDLLGNILLEKENLPANFSIAGSVFANGLYLYEIKSGEKITIGKMVKH